MHGREGKMSGFDLLKHLTQRLTSSLQPEEKPEDKDENVQVKEEHFQLTNRWLGILPFAIKLFFRQRKSGK